MVHKGVALVITDKDMYTEIFMALLNEEEDSEECREQAKFIYSKVV